MIVAFAALALQTAAPMPLSLHYGVAEQTCPVGGERFTAVLTAVYSIMGRRPDGKPYSDVPFPRPLPECPGNGLVMFARFTPAETEQLAKWIATPTYQRMRITESPFYRAYWLARKIGRPAADAIELLLPAIWSAKEEDRDPLNRPRTYRYQRALVAAVEAVPDDVPLDDRIWLRGQAANALREIGRFSAAERMRRRAEKDIPQSKRPALASYMQTLKDVIARKDRSDEPLDMVPEAVAASACKNRPATDDFSRAYCSRHKTVKTSTP